MKPKTMSARRKRTETEKDAATTYNEFKEFEGRKYTGMKVGRTHKWYYDKGEWREKKVTPEKWEFSYAVPKQRAGRAPEGSGVPVGTEYHWYILAHQNVRKLTANDYTTSMTGLKFKLAHKRADSGKWSVSEKTQRKNLIALLSEMIESLERQDAQEAAKPKQAARTRRKNGRRKVRPISSARSKTPRKRRKAA
ncbi:MAG: hypothetical protein ACRENP_19945 [Longimicrobiales bacterium]